MGKHDSSSNDPGSGTILPEWAGSAKVTDLSIAEKLTIYRRRQGYSQNKMAKIIGVHRNTYGRAERGEAEVAMIPTVYPLLVHEECFILRRRLDMTQKECADHMGITRYWYNLMENGLAPSKKLEEFWYEG